MIGAEALDPGTCSCDDDCEQRYGSDVGRKEILFFLPGRLRFYGRGPRQISDYGHPFRGYDEG